MERRSAPISTVPAKPFRPHISSLLPYWWPIRTGAAELPLDRLEGDGSVVVDGPAGVVCNFPDDAGSIGDVGVVATELGALWFFQDRSTCLGHLANNRGDIFLTVDIVGQRERTVNRDPDVSIEPFRVEQSEDSAGSDLDERDLALDVHDRFPPERCRVEAGGGVHVVDAGGDDIHSLIHDGHCYWSGTLAVLNESDSYRESSAPARWSHAVACTWTHRVGGSDTTHRVVPDGHADLIFFESGEIRVAGMHDCVDEPLLTAGTVAHGVRLRPEAVSTAFRLDARDLRNRSVDVQALEVPSVAALTWEVTEIDSWIATFEVDPAVAAATRSLRSGAPVRAIARQVGLSERQLQRRFNSAVGLGPKTYQRIARFQRFLETERSGTNLAERAHRAGYADQAHLTREARQFAGTTPAQLSP